LLKELISPLIVKSSPALPEGINETSSALTFKRAAMDALALSSSSRADRESW
jgi:hypothetical protein